MRLPSYTTQDEKELIRSLSSNIGGSEIIMAAEEYLNPGRLVSQHTLSTPVDTPLPPATPTQKFFPSNMAIHDGDHRNSTMIPASQRHSRYGSSVAIDGFSTLGSRSLRHSNNFFHSSCDPLKALGMFRYYNTERRQLKLKMARGQISELEVF
jgi:hypothetical protein